MSKGASGPTDINFVKARRLDGQGVTSAMSESPLRYVSAGLVTCAVRKAPGRGVNSASLEDMQPDKTQNRLLKLFTMVTAAGPMHSQLVCNVLGERRGATCDCTTHPGATTHA